MKKISFCVMFFFFLCVSGNYLHAEDFGFGVFGGVGTDINLGLGIGVKGSFFPLGVRNVPLEVGPEFFYAHTVEDSSEGSYDYTDTTDLIVFGVLANYLYNYKYESNCLYAILGLGLAVVSVEWEETSPNDTSLGTPWKSGSKMSAEGVAGGSVINIGVGYAFSFGLDLRFEIPVIIIFSAPGEASAVAPAFTFMAGYRF